MKFHLNLFRKFLLPAHIMISKKAGFPAALKKPAKKFTKEPVKKQPEKTVEKKEEKPVEKEPERKPENQPQSKAEKEVEVKKEEPQAKPAVTREKLPINKEAAEKDAKEFLEKMHTLEREPEYII